MKLHNQVIVITGASSGFGEEIARRCVREGAHVVLVARSADKLAQLVNDLGGATHATAIPTDVTDDQAVIRMAQQVLSTFGRVDVLVHSAGYGVYDVFAQAKLADLQGMMDVNVYGTVRVTQALLPRMLAQRRGQIVVIASAAGLISFRNMGFYSATKHALVAIYEALQIELTGSGLRCMIICPGVAVTPFLERALPSMYPRIAKLVPWMTASQVAQAVMRTIIQREEGRIVLPWQAIPLVVSGQLLPRAKRLVMRLIK